MLEQYYESARTIQRLRGCGPFGPHMDEFAQYLCEKSYSRGSVREYVRAAGHFSRYALWEGISSVERMDPQLAHRFVNEHLPVCSCERMNSGAYASTTTGTQHALDFLAGKGYFPPSTSMVPGELPSRHFIQRFESGISAVEKQMRMLASLPDTIGGLLLRYDDYLDHLFGLCKKTRDVHRVKTLLFLQWLYARHGTDFELSELAASDIFAFQEDCNETGYSRDYKKTITSCLRGFLRFLRWERILTEDLTPAVYKVIEWKLASVPKFIPYEDARRLISAVDRNTLKGKRDYLMLLLMLQLGLRANEVIQLRMEDIFLRKGELFVRETKTNRERVLPLTNELADAIVDYLRHRQPETPQRHVFIRSVAPRLVVYRAGGCKSLVQSGTELNEEDRNGKQNWNLCCLRRIGRN